MDSSIQSLVADIWNNLTKEQQMFAIALREYAKVLKDTVYTLEVRQKGLYLKSEKGAALPWTVFQTLEQEYKKAIAEYTRIGKEVNRLLHVVR
jgi:hypothetical protein